MNLGCDRLRGIVQNRNEYLSLVFGIDRDAKALVAHDDGLCLNELLGNRPIQAVIRIFVKAVAPLKRDPFGCEIDKIDGSLAVSVFEKHGVALLVSSKHLGRGGLEKNSVAGVLDPLAVPFKAMVHVRFDSHRHSAHQQISRACLGKEAVINVGGSHRDMQPSTEKYIPPLKNAVISLRSDIDVKNIVLQPENLPLEAYKCGDRTCFRIPEIKIHSVAVIEGQKRVCR